MSATSEPTGFRVGLLGNGIGPSLTPPMHVREGDRLGLDYHYEVVDLTEDPDVDLAAQLTRLEGAGFAAVNVTHPFKQQVLRHVHSTSEAVERIGAANLVLLGEHRVAHNTDYIAFQAALEEFLGDRERTTVLQVGAGGAGLATACALMDLGFTDIAVHDRSEAAAQQLVDRVDPSQARVRTTGGDLDGWLPRVTGVVHATPTGMRDHPGVAFDVGLLPASGWVAEIVYRPLHTELLRRAAARGLATLDGGAMAVGQAVESIRLITGREPDAARMHDHFAELTADGSAA